MKSEVQRPPPRENPRLFQAEGQTTAEKPDGAHNPLVQQQGRIFFFPRELENPPTPGTPCDKAGRFRRRLVDQSPCGSTISELRNPCQLSDQLEPAPFQSSVRDNGGRFAANEGRQPTSDRPTIARSGRAKILQPA